MSDNWKRVAGVHVEDDGRIAAVWLGWDKLSDVVTLYDACKFNNEVMAVIAEGLNARGRWIPVAWMDKAKPVSDKLQERGCNMLFDPTVESEFDAEMVSRDIQERMRTGRFKVEKRIAEWLQEFNVFREAAGKVPQSGYPLMAATRYAIANLKNSKRLKSVSKTQRNYPKVNMI